MKFCLHSSEAVQISLQFDEYFGQNFSKIMTDEESKEDVFFNKHFQLSTSPLALPDKSTWFQSKSKPVADTNLERFQALKNKLNNVKGLLNNYPLEKWHRHTRNQNPAGKFRVPGVPTSFTSL